MGPHNTSDDPTRYVDPAELEERRARDPIARVRRHLVARGLLDEAAEERLVDELRAEVDAAFAAAEAAPRPGPPRSSTTCTPTRPARLRRQRAAATGEDA